MSILGRHSYKCYFSVQFKSQVARVTIYNFFLQVNARQPRLPLVIAQFFRAKALEHGAVVSAVIKVLFLSKYCLFLSNNGF